MKVAVIDNTCNTGYVLMRFLNDRNIDTELIVLGGVEDHLDPLNDTFTNQYFDKIIYARLNEKGIWLTNRDIHTLLDKYDFVIGSDIAPALCYRIRKQLDIFMPHGTDIFEYPFRKINLKQFSKKDIGDWLYARWQWSGINSYTRYFLFDITNDENEAYVQRFKHPSFQRIWKSSPHIYYPQYDPQQMDQVATNLEYALQLKALRSNGFRIIMHHCQHVWKTPQHNLFNKGTDKIIQGFRQFLSRHPAEKVKLVLFMRGRDYEHSLALVKELQLEDHIVWLPSMPRKHIMACLSHVDVGIGELGHSWFSYNVITEFMAMKVPIIHNCDMDYYRNIHETVYPMYHAATAEDVAGHLSAFIQSPEAFAETGLQSHHWWRKHVADNTLDFIAGAIREKAEAGM